MAEIPQAIAVIPARGGSKRIPRKNVRLFNGLPMIAHSILAARESGVFDQILVSTEDEEIADVARRYGAEIPYLRPQNLADDKSGADEVFAHALAWLRDEGPGLPAHACLIYATAPFLQAGDLREARRKLDSPDTGAVCAATTFPFPIFRAFSLLPDGHIRHQWPEYRDVNSQDLPEMLHDAGQFLWIHTDTFFREGLFPASLRPHVLPRWRVQDIDTPEDWARAELMARILEQKKT